jgi:hypothetical protein
MSFSVIITLTYGSEAGPFDLYSDVDGYVTPFESNIPAGSFFYGYYTTNVPDGTTIIKVKSDGECINFVDLPIQNLPTPTPSITPTQTQTQTQTPSSTIGSTPTQTPSVTPTMTGFTGPCVCVEITVTGPEGEGPAGSIEYTNCFGTLINEAFLTQGTRYRCISYIGSVIQVISSTNLTYQIAAGYSCDSGTCPTTTVIPLTPTPTQTQTQTATPSSTLGSTPTNTPSQTATPTQTGTPQSTPGSTPTQTPSPSGESSCLCYCLTYTTVPNDLYVRYALCGTASVETELIQSLEFLDNGNGTYTACICVRQGGAYQIPVCVQGGIEVTCDPYIWVQGSSCSTSSTCFLG